MNTPVKRPSRLLLVFVSLLLAVFLAINAVAWFVVPSIAPAVVSMATGLINGVSRKPDQAALDATAASRDLTEEIEGESIVLLKNNGALPLSGKGKINLFGYASNDVMYGGSGSGGGDSSGNINIAEGLRNAGFEVNEELEAFYKERAVERDSTGFRGNDYSINEPAVSEYSEELLSHAKEYSDIAVISFSRAGGEGADLPIQSKGIYCYTKHFALNDQETFRDFAGICTWANEQSMRELYLRPFEIAVKKGKTMGIMSSFNRLGTTWTGASRPLLTNVLREEWGFKGAVVTDCANGFAYMDMNAGLRAGNDLLLTILLDGITEETTGTPTGRQALRRASHNILYMVANSDADQIAPDMTPVMFYILRAVDLVLAALFVLYFVRRHKKMKAYKAAVKGK